MEVCLDGWVDVRMQGSRCKARVLGQLPQTFLLLHCMANMTVNCLVAIFRGCGKDQGVVERVELSLKHLNFIFKIKGGGIFKKINK